jgi:hypothetical protein
MSQSGRASKTSSKTENAEVINVDALFTGEFYYLPHFTCYLYDLPLFTMTSFFATLFMPSYDLPLTSWAHFAMTKIASVPV